MADLRELVEQLKSNKPRKRRKACAEIAKTKNPEAIPILVRVYQSDQDEKVREAAAKALKTFRAMQPRESTGMSPFLRNIMLGLGGLLVLLIVVNVLVRVVGGGGSDEDKGETRDPGTLEDRQTLLTSYTENIESIETSAAAIVEELDKVALPDESPDCGRSIERPSPLNLTPREEFTYPDLYVAFGPDTTYRANIDALNAAYDEFKSSCGSIGVLEVIELTDKLTAIRDAIPGMLNVVNELEINPAPTRDPANFGQPTETPIPIPTATTMPTLLPDIDYDTHANELLAIIDRQSSGLDTIEQRWLDSQEGIAPSSCRTPEVDEDFELPEGQEGDVNLDTSVTLVNDALAILRSVYEIHGNECTSGNLAAFADTALSQLAEARAKFDEAFIRLNAVLGNPIPTEIPPTPEG